MFPVPHIFIVYYLIAYAIVGAVIGTLSGGLISLITTKYGWKGAWKDAILGAFGYLAGYIACALIPWPENTIPIWINGEAVGTQTMPRYQYPARVAIVLAILLPLLHEMYRFKRARAEQDAK